MLWQVMAAVTRYSCLTYAGFWDWCRRLLLWQVMTVGRVGHSSGQRLSSLRWWLLVKVEAVGGRLGRPEALIWWSVAGKSWESHSLGSDGFGETKVSNRGQWRGAGGPQGEGRSSGQEKKNRVPRRDHIQFQSTTGLYMCSKSGI